MHPRRHQRCPLSSAAAPARRRSPRPAHRHRAARPQGPGARRLRRDVDLAEPAAGLPDRAGPRRGPDRRGHRRQPVPRLRGGHRGQLDRPRPSRRSSRRSRSRRPSSSTSRASDFYLPIYPEVCQRLAELAPIEGGRARTYLGNSGAEVVEASIKLARYATHRPYVVAFLGAFHGRTYGAVSLTASKAKYHAGFGPLLPGVFHAPYGQVEDLAGSTRSCSTSSPRPTRSRRSSSSRSRARAATSSPRTASCRACATSATATASCSSPTRSSPAPAGPARCGRSSTGASSPTSC